MEFFNLDPSQQEDAEKDYSKIIWVQSTEDVGSQPADKLAQRFNDFGDFNIFKDSQSSFYMEFYYFEPKTVPNQNAEEVIKLLIENGEGLKKGVKAAVMAKDAQKFKAHNQLEYE